MTLLIQLFNEILFLFFFFFDGKRINLDLLNKPKNTIKTILTKVETTAQSFRGEGKREGGGQGEGEEEGVGQGEGEGENTFPLVFLLFCYFISIF